jgi:uncharacterized membrane protein
VALALATASSLLVGMAAPSPTRSRIEWIDLARGGALVAMAIYHFTWDLEFFGYAEPGMTAVGGWKLFARSIASSFLFLVGVSLVLSHAGGFRRSSFLRRLAMIAAAAAVVTTATWFATPDFFIFFGILHQIAFASVAGLLFLRLPPAIILAVAAAVIAAPFYLTSGAFDAPWWWWTGLSENRPRSSDFVPVFPWFAAVLIGMAAAKVAERSGFFAWIGGFTPGRWSKPLQFAGRNSLAVYLIHQPILIGFLWLFAQIFPATVQTPEVRFRQSCEASCEQVRTEEFCAGYCICVLDGLIADNRLEEAFSGAPSDAFRAKLKDQAAICTAETDAAIGPELE